MTIPSCFIARSKEITDCIAEMVAIDLRPLCIVEGEGFLSLLRYLEPGYKVTSAMHIASLVHCKHKTGQEKLNEILGREVLSVSFTTDIWTSIANDAYLTVSAHFISHDWELCSFVLCTSAFQERHTRAEISQKLISITEEFGIENKVVCVIHDQGCNMVLSMKMLFDEKDKMTK